MARQRENKSRTAPHLRLYPDFAPVVGHDTTADCEPHTDSRYLPTMETLEGFKDLPVVFGTDTDTVILDKEHPFTIFLAGLDTNNRVFARFPILDRIADKILEKLEQVGIARIDGWQFLANNLCVRFFDGRT